MIAIKKTLKEFIWQVRSLINYKYLPCKFLIVGAQKAGTTSLYDYITLHPDVVPSYEKEIQYFTKHYNKSKRWYQAHFKKAGVGKITGEASPYYMFHPLAASRIKKFDPNMKIIVLLRRPEERAYSHYKHQVRRGTESLSFADAISAEKERLLNEEKYILTKGENSSDFQRYSYRKRGEYLEQIQRLEEMFPKENIIIMSSDEFFENPLSCVQKVWGFLGLEEYVPSQALEIKNPGNYKIASKDRTTLNVLKDYYTPLNENLFCHLKKDFGWNHDKN